MRESAMAKIEWTKSVARFLKMLVAIVTAIGGFVIFDDWYSERTDLKIYPTNIHMDSTRVQLSPFELEPDELAVVSRIEQLGSDKGYLTGLQILRMRAVMGGPSELLTQINLHSLSMAERLMDADIFRDSLLLMQNAFRSPSVVDSVRFHLKTLQGLRSAVIAIAENHIKEMRRRVRIAVTVTVENSSSAQTALLEPGLLVVVFEGQVIKTRLDLTGAETELKMLGFEFQSGRATTIIRGSSLKELTFITDTEQKLGETWDRLKKALRQPSATGRVRFYTIDGTLVQSDSFSFSEDYHDHFVNDRFKALEAL